MRRLNDLVFTHGIGMLGMGLGAAGVFLGEQPVERAVMLSVGILVMALDLAVNRLAPHLGSDPVNEIAPWRSFPTPGDDGDDGDDDWDDLEDLDGNGDPK